MTIKRTRLIIRILRFIIVTGLLIGLWFLSNRLTQFNFPVELLAKASIILLGGWLLLSTVYHFVKKTVWIVITFSIVYLFGVYTYQGVNIKTDCTNTAWVKILAPINNTLSVFFPSRGSYVEGNLEAQAHYQAVHLLAYFFFAMLAISIFGRRLMNRSGYPFILKKQRNIFWGYGEAGKLLAKDILNKGSVFQQCIFVLPKSLHDDEDKEKLIFDKLDKMGAIVLYRDFEILKKRLPKGHRHFFLTDDQDFNVRMALKVAESTTKNSSKTHLYIRTEQERIDNFFETKPNVELHFFNQSDLTARKFVENYPMLSSPEIEIDTDNLLVNGKFRLLLLGFGWRGHELLKKCICDAQFKGSKFSATIIDNDFESKYGDYPVLYNECIEEYNLNFNPQEIKEVGSDLFYKWIDANILNYNRIIIALGDDCLNVEIATKIARILQCKEKGIKSNKELQDLIFAYVEDKENFNYYYQKENYKPKEASPITVFGNIEEIYTYDVVVNETMDRIAKMVNYVYSKYEVKKIETLDDKWSGNDGIEKRWTNEKSIFKKNSSRAVALNVQNIYKIVKEDWSVLNDDKNLEILAENEHLRWNAFHFVNGIRKWNLADINTHNGKDSDANCNLLRHGCLTDFEMLNLVSAKVNEIKVAEGRSGKEDYQETDRRITRHFHLFWQEMGKQKNTTNE